jgi:hypothetical protein
VEQLRHLVVVIPGIGGSVLAGPGDEARWDTDLHRIAEVMAKPERLDLSEFPRLTPVGLIPATAMLRWTVVQGYDGLVRKICNAFRDVRVDTYRPGRDPDLGADVVLFPYDFRLGVRDAAERLKAAMEARLGGLTPRARSRRVIVVAHSMGGLVARCWLGPLGGAPDCATLITVGTPHRGTPKALDWLVNGVRAGPVRLAVASEVLRDWPSAYDLLPRYPAVLPEDKARAAHEANQEQLTDALYPHQLGTLAGRSFAARAGESYAQHQEIDDTWTAMTAAGTAPAVTALFARGHATPARAILGAWLTVSKKRAPGWLPNSDWLGDGTVPANAAIPLELDDDRRAWRAVPDRHQPMAATSTIIDLLRSYSADSMAAMRGTDRPERPWLGLDLDELTPADQPIPVSAELLGTEPGDDTALSARVRPTKPEPASLPYSPRYPMRRWDGRWHAVLPGQAPGSYRVTVEAVNVPRTGSVRCAEEIGVIEP